MSARREPRILFGAGALERLAELIDELDARRVLVVASAGRVDLVERVRALLGPRFAGTDERAVMHVPASVADAVRAHAAAFSADLVLAVGGGSAIGVAKAASLGGGPPNAAVPTTYSGSEMTPIWGVTRDGTKETGRDERVRPRAVLYDPTLTLDLPPRVSGPSALNAAAHCVEALYAPDATADVRAAAVEGLRALAQGAPRVVRAPVDLAARTLALHGARLAGASLGSATMGLHHKLCHVLGGSFGLPHAELHAVILPYAAAYNAPATPSAMAAIADALGAIDAPAALHALLLDVNGVAGAPVSLGALGFHRTDIARAAALVIARPYANPAPVTEAGVRALLERAWEGKVPS